MAAIVDMCACVRACIVYAEEEIGASAVRNRAERLFSMEC